MTENLDFYDCNSSSNSLLKFDLSSIEVDIAEEISTSPDTVEVLNFEGQMHTMNSNNPLLSTASIPLSIPKKSDFSGITNNSNNNRVLADLSDIVFEFEKSQSPMNDSGNSDNQGNRPNQIIISNDGNFYGMQNTFGNNLTWEINSIMNSTNMMITDPGFQMDEDDIFQVDKSDLIQGPTLAELNGDNLYKDLLNMEEMLTSESAQNLPSQNNQNQFTQLTTANFHNLQNAIESSNMNSMEIPQQMFHTINVPQTPHNTPSCPSYLSGGNIIFYEDQPSNSPYEVYSPPNTVPTSSLIINTIRMANNPQSAGQMSAFSPGSHSSTSTSSVLLNSSLSPPQQNQFSPQSSVPLQSPRSQRSAGVVQHNPKFTTLHELLMKKDHIAMSPSPPSQLLNNNNNNASLSPSGLSGLSKRLHMSGGSISRLSSSAPSHSGLESIWQRREPRQHLLSTGSLAEAGSTSSLSGVLSPEAPDLSQDEAYSDDDSDHYEDFSSGNYL